MRSFRSLLKIQNARCHYAKPRKIIYEQSHHQCIASHEGTPPSFSSIFRLAARIISSLLRFSASARDTLSELHAFLFCSSLGTGSLPFPLNLPCNPYLVIKSGCPGEGRFSPLAPLKEPCPAVAGAGILGWNDGGGLSRPLPASTLSVVAATFPPLRCKSQAIALRSSCGNIEDT